MPPYTHSEYEYLLTMFGVGLLIVIAVLLARGSRRFYFSFKKQSERELEQTLHEFGGGVKEYNRPMPLLIWLVFIGYFIWATGYIIFSGLVAF